MSEKIVDRIEDYLDIHAPSQILDRGEKLFKDKKVGSASINKKNGTANFEVRGGSLYIVVVSGLNDYVKSRCTCPYDWGPVCKHQVAALRYLQEEFGGRKEKKNQISEIREEIQKYLEKKTPKSKPQPKIELRTSSTPFLISDYQLITQELLQKYTSNYYYSESEEIETEIIADNKLHFTYSNYYNTFRVKFWHTSKGLMTSCSCNKKVKKLCLHQSSILGEIANSNQPDIFELIIPKNLKALKNEMLDVYGLTGKKFNSYFNFDYVYFEIEISLKPEYRSLLPVKGNETIELQYETGFKELENNSVKIEVPVIENRKSQKRSPGFAFFASSDMDLPLNDEMEIVVVSGKENKQGNKLISHFKGIDNLNRDEHLVFTEKQKELVEKITYFEASKENGIIPGSYDRFLEKQKHMFDFLKRIFPLLLTEKYLFVLSDYDAYYKIRKSDLEAITIEKEYPEIKFELTDDDTFLHLTPKFLIHGVEQSIDKIDKYKSHFLYSIINNILYLHKSISQSLIISQFGNSKMTMVKTEAKRFFSNYVQPISKYCKIDFKSDLFALTEKNINPVKKQIFLSDYGDFVVFKPMVKYEGNLSFEPGNEGSSLVKDPENNVTIYIRSEEYENDFLDFVSNLHPEFESQKNAGRFYLQSDVLMDDFWFFDAYEKMEKGDIEVYGLKDLKSFKYNPYRANISSGIKSGQDWFEVEVEVAFGDMTLDLKSLKRAVMRQEKYVQLKDGSVGILPEEWLHKFQRYFRAGEIKDDKLQISKLKFSIIDELFEDIDNVEIMKELAEKRQKLKNIEKISAVRKPKEITATLRDYQKEGLNWLNMLNELGWGGILADDMGLGKTLQVLTLLQKEVKKNKKTNLVIVPTTLLFNWEIELKKFAPQLTYHFYYGIDRNKEIKHFKNYNLVFTTYGVLVRDIESLKNYKFNYIILDESQAIKNPASLRYKAAFLLQAANKLTLTGTPIENSTFDLYAQMNFVNPGFFGSRDSFKEDYSKAIDKEGNVEVSKELSKMVTPFLLRRTKEQVAKDLPEKTENILFCEMGNEQRQVYDAFRNKYRNQLLGRIEKEGLGKSKIYVLEGLMKLRQICDSPAILSDKEDYGTQSVKIEELVRHINQKTSNHKILVFSQFVKMLKLIKEELVRDKINFEYLDGQSTKKKRQESVEHFQENPDCRVFLISLKAGGTGLNLTAADYVYIVDPWWNPAVENQAIDRTHRIGQKNNVFAYRMICKDTVEEKILNLQAKKKKIAKDIISTDESLVKKLTEKDIRELFS
jgi:SNF2 family DNA or RNA helicase